MRINLHDFSGHPFQVQLARHLAARGHDVLHQYCAQYVTGHGALTVGPDDPATLRIEAVDARRTFDKYDPARRIAFELGYSGSWRDSVRDETFDVVVACNVPLVALDRARRRFEGAGQPWVFWHQDVYSLGVGAEVSRRLPAVLARPVRAAFTAMEKAQVREADRVVAIGDQFVTQYREWGLTVDHVDVIPNWAPLAELTPGPRDNAWSTEHGLAGDALRLLYAGTLGRKHNPLLLLDLLDAVRARGVGAELVVCSQGLGADDLAAASAGRSDVRILGFQPAERFAEVLASADVMVALLEPDAAAFSVPSKVLSYLCAGRPTVGLMPAGNPAAFDILTAGGTVAAPTPAGARGAASWLADTVAGGSGALASAGAQARALAEERFDIDAITDRFEAVLTTAARSRRA